MCKERLFKFFEQGQTGEDVSSHSTAFLGACV